MCQTTLEEQSERQLMYLVRYLLTTAVRLSLTASTSDTEISVEKVGGDQAQRRHQKEEGSHDL